MTFVSFVTFQFVRTTFVNLLLIRVTFVNLLLVRVTLVNLLLVRVTLVNLLLVRVTLVNLLLVRVTLMNLLFARVTLVDLLFARMTLAGDSTGNESRGDKCAPVILLNVTDTQSMMGDRAVLVRTGPRPLGSEQNLGATREVNMHEARAPAPSEGGSRWALGG